MKQILPLIIATATINNAPVGNTTRANADIINYPNLIQQIATNNNDDLVTGTYYQIKEFSNDLQMMYGTIEGKGYQYLYVNKSNEIYRWKTEYYFRMSYQDGDQNNFDYDEMTINLRGFINTNTRLDPYYEEYTLYYSNSNETDIDSYIDNDTYNLQMLETTRTAGTWIALENTYIDTVGTNCQLTLPNRYKYAKWSITWKTDEIYTGEQLDEIDTSQIPNMLNSLQNVYSSITTTYSYKFEIEYEVEVIDIPDLIFTIIGLPFAWISTAFNLTLFAGTPYAINVSRLMFEIMCCLIIIIIIRKVIK